MPPSLKCYISLTFCLKICHALENYNKDLVRTVLTSLPLTAKAMNMLQYLTNCPVAQLISRTDAAEICRKKKLNIKESKEYLINTLGSHHRLH